MRRTATDGQLVHQIPATGLREIAIDSAGSVYGARVNAVQRLADSGLTVWTQPVRGRVPSIRVGEVPPYLASMAWNSRLAEVTLLFDHWDETLLRHHTTSGQWREEGLGFPTHTYWDIDYQGGRALVLNRALRTIEVYQDGVWQSVVPSRGLLPAPAERIAPGPDGTYFFLSNRRWVWRLDASGKVIDVWDGTDPEPGRTASTATDIAVDAIGQVYVTDPDRGQVRVYGFHPLMEPGAPPDTEPDPDRCQTVPIKFANPNYLTLGEKTKVTLQLGGSCPARAEKADILVIVDRSTSMSWEDESGQPKIVAARKAVSVFVGLMNLERDQVGLVTFESTPQLLVPLTQDRAQIERAIGTIRPEGGTDIAGGIQVASAELRSVRRRPDAKAIIVLLTDGNPFNTTRLTTVAASDQARNAGTTIYTIGLGEDADPYLLKVLATTPRHFFFAPTAGQLEHVYREIAHRISASVLLKQVTIVDRVPTNMEYQDDGTTVPPAVWDRGARTLTWTFTQVPFSGIEMSYWLRPLDVGDWPTNVRADYDGTGGLDQPQEGPFPIPHVIVVAPTSTPTITNTPPPTPTGTRPPTNTAIPTPTPRPTWTPVTPTVTTTPSPTATPERYSIYVIIVFNDQCFQRYTDVVLVIDASTTMLFQTPDGMLKLDAAKAAAHVFIKQLALRPDLMGRHDQAAIVWYNDTAGVAQSLTNNRDGVELAIDSIAAAEGTRIDLGIELAHAQLLIAKSPRRRIANTPAIVLLSDGIPNRTTIENVIHAADEAKKDGIAVYTVGFGADVREDNLRRTASQPGMYFYAPTGRDLARIYNQIAGDLVCR